MKNFTPNNITQWVIGAIFLVVLFFNIFNSTAIEYINEIHKDLGTCSTIVSGLHEGAKAAGSIKIPIVSGSFESASDILLKCHTWLSYSSLILLIQKVILLLSKSLILKILAVASFVGLFINRYKSQAIKFLLIIFLINPGLSIYVMLNKQLSSEFAIDFGKDLKADLQANKKIFDEKHEQNQQQIGALKEKYLEEQLKKGKTKENFFQRVEVDISKVFFWFKEEVSLGYKDLLTVLKDISKDLMPNIVTLFANLFVMFIILPFGYLFLFNVALKNLFREDLLSVPVIEKMKEKLTKNT